MFVPVPKEPSEPLVSRKTASGPTATNAPFMMLMVLPPPGVPLSEKRLPFGTSSRLATTANSGPLFTVSVLS